MMKIPSTKGLLAFDAAARSLSILGAARELNVTPGAVSRQIQNLEELLGCKLFARRHKQIDLTRLGRDFHAEISVPLARLGEVTRRFQAIGGGGTISICAYPTFAIRWLIPRWSRFYDSHPNIDLRLMTTLNPVEFATGGYDFTIQVLREGEAPPGYTAHKLSEVDVFPVCSPALAERLRKPQDLARTTLLHCAPRPDDWHRWLESEQLDDVEPGKGLHFESLNLAFQGAIEGLGVAMGIGALIEEDLAQGRLTRPFAAFRRSEQPFHLVHAEDREEDADFISFRDWVLLESEPRKPPISALDPVARA
jgi:LysR family glycine cleavage system transcriptional activator